MVVAGVECVQGTSKLEDFQSFVIRTPRGEIPMIVLSACLFVFFCMAGSILTISLAALAFSMLKTCETRVD